MKNQQAKRLEWWVYFARCNDDSLYCGISTNVNQRIKKHNSKSCGAKYTRSRQPVHLVYTEGPYDKKTALVRENKIKKMTKKQKENLIENNQL